MVHCSGGVADRQAAASHGTAATGSGANATIRWAGVALFLVAYNEPQLLRVLKFGLVARKVPCRAVDSAPGERFSRKVSRALKYRGQKAVNGRQDSGERQGHLQLVHSCDPVSDKVLRSGHRM